MKFVALLNAIQARIKELATTERQALLKASLKPDAIRTIRRGHAPKIATLRALEKSLQMEPNKLINIAGLSSNDVGEYAPATSGDVIDSSAAQSNATPAINIRPPAIQSMPKDVPVLGVTVGGADGDFQLNGEVVEMVRRPAGISPASRAFAVYVQGNSMSPRFERGDLIFVNPTRPAAPICDVVIELVPKNGDQAGVCLIKRLLKETSTKYVLYEFNPPREFDLPKSKVRQVWRVYTNAELYSAG